MSEATQHIFDVLRAIAEGNPVRGEMDRFVIVQNPNYQPDDGSDRNLVIDIQAARFLTVPEGK